jgi:hypothetical protein
MMHSRNIAIVRDRFASDWAQAGFKVERFLTADNAVLVIGRYAAARRARAPETEPKPDAKAAAHIYLLRDGEVTTSHQYRDMRTLWDLASLS